jgi:DNA-binding response OmpR family regulator
MAMQRQLKILIVEDNSRTITLLTKFLESLDHQVVVAENGQLALDKFDEEQPDLILTDLNMPILDGISLIKQIREKCKDTWIPILILSAYGEEKDIITGLEAGADDYLTKPINMSILRAKILAMYRTVALQWNNAETLRSLEAINKDLHDEQFLAKQLADKILQNGDLQTDRFAYWLCPAAQLSGDFIASKKVGEKRYVMIADSTGHGLAAALPTLAMARIFNAMSQRGFSIESIVTEMNKETSEMLPADRFVAAAVFIIDYRHQLIECWNGGLPPAVVVTESGNVVHEFPSKHLALSILSEEKFETGTEMYHWNEACQLITYSDGVLEAESPMGQQFGQDNFYNLIRNTTPNKRLEELQSTLLKHVNADSSTDDISVAVIDCN